MVAGKAVKTGDGKVEVLAKVAEMPARFDAVGRRLHEIIMQTAPGRQPRGALRHAMVHEER